MLLAELTGVLGDVIRRALDEQEDIEVVGEVSDPAGVRVAVMTNQVDLVIWGTGRATDSGIDTLLQWQHPPKVLAVEDDGRHGSVWQLRHQSVALGQLSPGVLVEAIRRVCGENSGQGGVSNVI